MSPMTPARLYFATNRKHIGKDRWNPKGYGKDFSGNGSQNLRFGEVNVPLNDNEVNRYLKKSVHGHKGDGEGLSKYIKGKLNKGKIMAYRDLSHETKKEIPFEKNASSRAFRNLKAEMEKASDVLIYIHGYNVDWEDAVSSALALQYMLNRGEGDQKNAIVFLYSWPSDGSAMPFAAYWSDRSDAEASGASMGRGMLKLHSFMIALRNDAKKRKDKLCNQEIHILCHSMGNYVLQNALNKMIRERADQRLPRLFNHLFLCAPDVDDDVLELGKPMARLHELGLFVSVYYNNGDLALHGSDITKGHPDRLGQTGVANESMMHRKVHQIDCTPIVRGLVEHSYYLWGRVNDDIQMSIKKVAFDSEQRGLTKELRNSWMMK